MVATLSEGPKPASSSNYTSRTHRCTSYDVFLSFRGEDTRLGFTDHLYTALVSAGFSTFRDDDELDRGESIKPELHKAIQDSKCSVIVFSKDYASSRWCLDELVTILERKKTADHVVLPIFYDVDPSEVRKQNGSFAEAFARHQERFKAEISKVNRWKAALEEAADLVGMNLQNQADRHEAKFIKKIVIVLEDKLRRHAPLNVPPYLIGIVSQVEEISSWLADGSTDVGILLICGIPGIGKTTITKAVYNLNFNSFEGSAFLENISEVAGQPNGFVQLQRELLYILTKREMIIHNVSEGINKIRDVISFKRVFLVLDDVDHVDQLDKIIGLRDWFYHGSKIVITTRQHAQLLKAREVYEVHEVQQLGEDESLMLFSWHAFGQDRPIEQYKQLSEKLIDHCGGLPLALQTLGRASLSWRSIDYWESAIEKLKDIPDSQILRKVKICYDNIQDDYDKNIFLDITCFFIGVDKDFTVTILEGCNFHAKIGIQNLIDRYLITIDEHNRLRMHNLLRDMGREIVRQESPKEPGRRSRLWKDKDSYNVLIEKKGENTIEGIVLHGHSIPSIDSSNMVVVETNAFAKMDNLRLLILSGVRLSRSYESFPKRLRWLIGRGYESFPQGLRWLSWNGYPLHSIPGDFRLQSLVALDMPYSNLRQVWEESKSLPQLKILNLSHSHFLTKTPDFSLLPKLETLILSKCASLVYIHESICTLKFLEKLDVSGCSNLIKFPLLEFQKIESLKVFHADGTPMNRWLNAIVDSLANPWPRFLVEVSLANCNLSDDDFPKDFSNLSSLQSLNLSDNQMCGLPDCIRSLNELNYLCFRSCKRLQSVVGLPRIKQLLDVTLSPSLEKVTFQSASCRPQSIGFPFPSYKNIVEFEYWFKLEPIGSIDVEMINILGLSNLESMKNIEIYITSLIWQQTKRLPIQGIHEHGIFNIFLPGKEIPSCYNHKSRDTSISFMLPTLPVKNIEGLKISTIYSVHQKLHHSSWLGHMVIQVSNKNKFLKWIYVPTFFGCQDVGTDMIWLSYWKLGNRLEVGDEVIVSIFMCTDDSQAFEFKECGIHVVYKPEEKMSTLEKTSGDPSGVGGNSCGYWQDSYEVLPGTYFLSGGPSSPGFRQGIWSNWKQINWPSK